MYKIILSVSILFTVNVYASKQLMNLTTSDKPRFSVTDISWPKQYGQAEICLWKNDKYAALSITIDDNCKPDHKWWLKQCKEFGFPVTWFIITGKVGAKNKRFFGSWDDFAKLIAAGHSVQSHSITHGKNDNKRTNGELHNEYRNSKKAIEKNIPGNKCLAIAYPWGKGKPELAAEYFIAARGTTGTPNPANRIDYMNTCGGHLKKDMIDSVAGNPVTNPKWLASPRFKRGWASLLHHTVKVGRTPQQQQSSISRVREFLEYAHLNRNKLWIDTFVNVAKYGQERDTAKIQALHVRPGKISFNLTDDMNDRIFDAPLTVKVRLDKNWNQFTVTQAEKPVHSLIVEYKGNKYALVQVVPDCGLVVISQEKD